MAKALVIGAGIGGISAALHLRKLGYEVEVFEKNHAPGGKMQLIDKEGYIFDAGPSLFTLPHLIDEIFDLFDSDRSSYLEYYRKDSTCNYFWDDGSRFVANADTAAFCREAAEFFGVPERNIENYLKSSAYKYELTADIFLRRSLHQFNNYLRPDTLKALLNAGSLDLFQSLNEVNEEHLSNPKLVQLFNRYATYNGSSPYKTPGIMSMIPHLEMELGSFYPKGGMYAIVKALHQLSLDQGIKFHFNTSVHEILMEGKSTVGIRTDQGIHLSELTVCNMDMHAAYEHIMPSERKTHKSLEQECSSSALVFYWGIDKEFPELDLHNIFFSEDYKNEFKHLFDTRELAEDLTVYVNITSKEEAGMAPEGHENWFVMVNAPANYGQDWKQLKAKARKLILQKLNPILSTDLEKHIVVEESLDPLLIESNTFSHRGALYGSSSNSKFSAFLRHPNFSQEFKNLYFCGGSVHPGGGIPLCLMSGKIVADLVAQKS